MSVLIRLVSVAKLDQNYSCILKEMAVTADLIARLSVKKFESLPKSGKPKSNEWTVLSTIVQQYKDECKVVALGCGTKCLGATALRASGFVLNDAHAEILVRRAFLRYLYYELTKATNSKNTDSIFEFNNDSACFAIKPGMSFHFFCTQTPCGDACIIGDDDVLPNKRRRLAGDDDDELYTGAKLIDCSADIDAMLQTVGAVRTKPGRGDRTLSVSCSDKLAKWCVLGITGALLDTVVHAPIYFGTLNFACGDSAALERAFYGRWQDKDRPHIATRYVQKQPVVYICTPNVNTFAHKQDIDKQPSPNGLVWCDLPSEQRPYEISVNGIRQGVTKKQLNTPQAALRISKYHLLQSYVTLLRLCPSSLCKRIGLSPNSEFDEIPYSDFKKLAISYQNSWECIRRDYFGQWTCKPIELTKFSLKSQS